MATLRARRLRNNLTRYEVIMWARLKRLRAMGYHFRRQAPFRGYYLDFVCFNHLLVVEVDGAQHAEDDGAEWDRVRDGVLERAGFQVLRFWNADARDRTDEVVEGIMRALEARPATRASRAVVGSVGDGVTPP